MERNTLLPSLVQSVMHSPVVTIDRKDTLRSAGAALRDADVGTLVIMDGSVLAGIVSERDIVWALADGADPDRVQVADVMSGDPRYLTVGQEMGSAVETMLDVGVRHLPVLEEGEVVGILSIRDLLGTLRA